MAAFTITAFSRIKLWVFAEGTGQDEFVFVFEESHLGKANRTSDSIAYLGFRRQINFCFANRAC